MHKPFTFALLTSTLFATNVKVDLGSSYGFRYDQYAVTDFTSTNKDKVKYTNLQAITTGAFFTLTAEETLYLGISGTYGVVVSHPKADIYHNGVLSDNNTPLDKKYAIEADGVMGYQFYLKQGKVLLCPQIGYGYAKYKLTDTLTMSGTQIGAFSVSNGAPYAGVKVISLFGKGSSFHTTMDYFYAAFRHETPVLDVANTKTTFRMSTLQGPRIEFKFDHEFQSGWFIDVAARGRYLFSTAQKVLLLYGANPEKIKSGWLTVESAFSFGYNF